MVLDASMAGTGFGGCGVQKVDHVHLGLLPVEIRKHQIDHQPRDARMDRFARDGISIQVVGREPDDSGGDE